ncbi:Scr1 family TA system antitoxin-like transcriptional regulator [Saccharopolyspora sp. NPDC003752]
MSGEEASRPCRGPRGPRVAAEQFRHVLKETERQNIEIRVAPTALGAHLGLDGGFSLLEFTRGSANIYVEAHNSGLLLNDPAEEPPFRATISRLGEVALSPEESARLIATYAARFESEGA